VRAKGGAAVDWPGVNVGLPELLVVLVVALIVLGPTRLPEAARHVGKAMAELRRMNAGLQAEVRDAFHDPLPMAPPPPPSTDAGEKTEQTEEA
jgi:TatA/E family protein of Tat protein translocase